MLVRRRSMVAMVLATALLSSPASAFTFGLAGDGSSQQLTWLWEYIQTSYHSCLSSPTPCGNVSSTSGRIPLQGFSFGIPLKTGGMLDWTASSGSLKTVALTTVYARPTGSPNGFSWVNDWAAVNARETPLDFVVLGEPGDPFPLDLQLLVRPKLVGSVDHYSYPNSDATLFLQIQMSVTVDGVVVSQDTLTREYTRANGQLESYALGLPKGASNGAVVHVTNGSLVSIMMWQYMRCTANAPAFVYTYSSYGEGPALEIEITNANAVAVDDGAPLARLSLAASPNPMKGSARITYALPKAADMRVSVYDVAGHRVAQLRNGREPAGPGEVIWSGRSDEGPMAPAGIYLVELVAGTERRVQRLAVLGGR